jgi:hypothetical protein
VVGRGRLDPWLQGLPNVASTGRTFHYWKTGQAVVSVSSCMIMAKKRRRTLLLINNWLSIGAFIFNDRGRMEFGVHFVGFVDSSNMQYSKHRLATTSRDYGVCNHLRRARTVRKKAPDLGTSAIPAVGRAILWQDEPVFTPERARCDGCLQQSLGPT